MLMVRIKVFSFFFALLFIIFSYTNAQKKGPISETKTATHKQYRRNVRRQGSSRTGPKATIDTNILTTKKVETTGELSFLDILFFTIKNNILHGR